MRLKFVLLGKRSPRRAESTIFLDEDDNMEMSDEELNQLCSWVPEAFDLIIADEVQKLKNYTYRPLPNSALAFYTVVESFLESLCYRCQGSACDSVLF